MLATILKVTLLVTSVVMVLAVLMQSSNSAGLSGAIGGGAEQLFGKKKSQGYEGILVRITTVCAVLFISLSIVLVKIQS